MNQTFKSILFLDDVRTPTIYGIDVVRNYDEFVWFMQNKPQPELISFDHDLATEHYPHADNQSGQVVSYDQYEEKTGYHCAQWIVDNKIPIWKWTVHSMNPAGRANIERVLRAYSPRGEVKGIRIPYSL